MRLECALRRKGLFGTILEGFGKMRSIIVDSVPHLYRFAIKSKNNMDYARLIRSARVGRRQLTKAFRTPRLRDHHADCIFKVAVR